MGPWRIGGAAAGGPHHGVTRKLQYSGIGKRGRAEERPAAPHHAGRVPSPGKSWLRLSGSHSAPVRVHSRRPRFPKGSRGTPRGGERIAAAPDRFFLDLSVL